MITGLPPVARGREPASMGRDVTLSPVGEPRKNSRGLSATRYRVLDPPPQYSYGSIHLPSVVGTALAMPGRPQPISVFPPPMSWLSPARSTTGALHCAPTPSHV